VAQGGYRIDPTYLPTYNDVAGEPKRRGWLGAGLSAGVDQLQGMGGAALQGVGALAGISPLETLGRDISVSNQLQAEQNGRPDLEIAPWKDGGAPIGEWLGYQTAKQIPQLIGYLGAGALVPEAAVPAFMTRLGAAAPSLIGGGGLKAGANFAARRAAMETGETFAKRLIGGEIVGTPLGFGSMVQEADQAPGGLTTDTAARAAAFSPLYAGLDAFDIPLLSGMKALKGNIASKVVRAGLIGAAEEVPQEGLQTAMEVSFRPDMSTSDKMTAIVDAAVTGGAVGGVLGGMAGVRRMKTVDPTEVDNDSIKSIVDDVLQPAGPQQLQLEGPGNVAVDGSVMVNGRNRVDGRFAPGSSTVQMNGNDFEPSEFDVAPVTPRPFESSTTEELIGGLTAAEKQIDAETASDEVIRFAELAREELSLRDINSSLSETTAQGELAGVVEPDLRLGGTQSSEAPTPATQAPWTDQRDTLLKGISTRKWYREAETPDDLDRILVGRLKDGSTAKSDFELAKRRGIDTDGLGTSLEAAPPRVQDTIDEAPVATRTAEQVAAAELVPDELPKVSPRFAKWWDRKRGSSEYRKMADDVHALNPTNKQDLEKKVYAALGAQDFSRGMERLATDLNILDNNKRLTPHGEAIARQAISMEEATTAAVQQGYTGLEASSFDMGARSVRDLSQNMDEGPAKQAYIAGRQWGVPKVASAQWSESQARDAANADVRDASFTLVPKVRMSSAEIKERSAANRYIDNLTGLDEGSRASLKQMAKGGATKQDIDNALEYVRTGRGALLREQVPSKPFQPVRRADLTGSMTGAMMRQQGGMTREGRSAGQAQAQENSKIESMKAIKRDELRKEAAAAFESGDLSQIDYMRMLNDIHKDDIDAAIKRLPGHGDPVPYATLPSGEKVFYPEDYRAASRVIDGLLNGGLQGGLDAIEQLGNPLYNHLKDMVQRMRPLIPADVEVRVESPQGMFARVPGALGLYYPDTNEVYVGVGMPHPSILVHELAHAITSRHIKSKTAIGREIDSIYNLFKKYGPTNDYAFTNSEEFMAEFMSRVQIRNYIEKWQKQHRVGSVFQRIWSAIREMLGMPRKNYVERLFQLAEAAGSQPLDHNGEVIPPSPITVSAVSGNYRDTVQKVTGAADGLLSKRQDLRASGRRGVIGWNSMAHLGEHYYDEMPAIKDEYNKAHFERRATTARWAQLFEEPYQAYEQLEKSNPKLAQSVRWLMGLTEFEIDPRKTWSQHGHLHGMSNAARLKELVNEGNERYNTLRRTGANKVYDDFRSINEATHYAMMAVSLHNLVATDPSLDIPGFERDPSEAFRESADVHESPQEARNYWREALDEAVKNASGYVSDLRGSSEISEREQKALGLRLSPVELRLQAIRDSLAAMEQAPYFHLGRFGDHFVSFHLRTGKDSKEVDPKAMDHVARVIRDAGFKDLVVSRDSTKPKVYARVDSIEAREQLVKLAEKLKAEGWLSKDDKHQILAGPRSMKTNFGTAEEAPAYVNRLIQEIEASPMFKPDESMSEKDKAQLEARKRETVAHIRELYLDMLPDTALSKVMVHRNAVPGYNEDMVRNFAFRFQVGINSLANLSMIPKLNSAFTHMREAVHEAEAAGSGSNVDVLNDLYNEVATRETERPLKEGSDWIDKWRAMNHAYFLGFSPSYALVNMTQLGVLLWPELGKKHSFVKAAKAIAKVTPMAFKILQETFKQGGGFTGKRSADAVITSKILKGAGIPPATADFLMRQIAKGNIDIGGSSRELSRVVDASLDSKLDNGLRYAAAIGLYSETFTRLVAALSARDLHGGGKSDVDDYATSVVNESMLNYANWNTARQMGKGGMFGRFTPVMMSFLQYSAQVMEKLYRELHTAFLNSAKTDKEKTEARRFLASHATAVMTLAGSLGLPFATVAATAIEKLVDLFDDDDEPYDATAAWRNMLADVFGKEIGEIAARGAPRALNIDLSSRTGEQNLLPFSQLIADRRRWQDAMKDFSMRSAGAPVSMLLNIASGGEKIADGDLLSGMKDIMPSAIKGPVEAYRMKADGYKDSKGNVLPMTPGATDLLAQSLGFTPAEKAEYSEARGDQAARRGDLTRRATVLRNQIVNAVIDGDMDSAGELIREASDFDRDNPAFAVLPDIDNAIRRRMRSQAMSASASTPIGVSLKDIQGQDLTAYANVDYRAQ
jgi:hypothetical protein